MQIKTFIFLDLMVKQKKFDIYNSNAHLFCKETVKNLIGSHLLLQVNGKKTLMGVVGGKLFGSGGWETLFDIRHPILCTLHSTQRMIWCQNVHATTVVAPSSIHQAFSCNIRHVQPCTSYSCLTGVHSACDMIHILRVWRWKKNDYIRNTWK